MSFSTLLDIIVERTVIRTITKLQHDLQSPVVATKDGMRKYVDTMRAYVSEDLGLQPMNRGNLVHAQVLDLPLSSEETVIRYPDYEECEGEYPCRFDYGKLNEARRIIDDICAGDCGDPHMWINVAKERPFYYQDQDSDSRPERAKSGWSSSSSANNEEDEGRESRRRSKFRRRFDDSSRSSRDSSSDSSTPTPSPSPATPTTGVNLSTEPARKGRGRGALIDGLLFKGQNRPLQPSLYRDPQQIEGPQGASASAGSGNRLPVFGFSNPSPNSRFDIEDLMVRLKRENK